MKINWGYGLLITFILFGTLIFSLVYGSMKTRVDLVSDQYYKDELRYQEKLDKANNAIKLNTQLSVTQDENGVLLSFPKETLNNTLNGKIQIYCIADSRLDKELSVKTDDSGFQRVERNNFLPGKYALKIDWTSSGTEYYTEKTIFIR
jgi:hypothetical protein